MSDLHFDPSDATHHGLPDAAPGNWVDRWLPSSIRPFARLARWDRPIGIYLLMWPCWWSSLLADLATGASTPGIDTLVLFFIGAVAMRGAGCTYNDIVDRKIDAEVERTRGRPIPSGDTSVWNAALFMVLQALIGLIVLLQFNALTVRLGFISLILIAIYPFMKRVTNWPQAVLGLAFGWGALVGWTATRDHIDLAPLLLYLGTIAWIIGYDTIYAHQDREDDALIGMKSTALKFGARTKPWLTGLYAVTILFFILAAVMANGSGLSLLGIAIGGVTLAWQVGTLDINDPVNCLKRFQANHRFGMVVAAGFALDVLARWLV